MVSICLSLFVSAVSAAVMPIDLKQASTAEATVADYDHCHGVASIDHDEDTSRSSSSVSHYCCSALAVLTNTPAFALSRQTDAYLAGEIVVHISNITESIYKPPKNYL